MVSPWPAIEEALKSDLIEYSNQIKAKTYEGSYGQYLKIALLHLQGRKQAQGLRANGCHVDAWKDAPGPWQAQWRNSYDMD